MINIIAEFFSIQRTTLSRKLSDFGIVDIMTPGNIRITI